MKFKRRAISVNGLPLRDKQRIFALRQCPRPWLIFIEFIESLEVCLQQALGNVPVEREFGAAQNACLFQKLFVRAIFNMDRAALWPHELIPEQEREAKFLLVERRLLNFDRGAFNPERAADD